MSSWRNSIKSFLNHDGGGSQRKLPTAKRPQFFEHKEMDLTDTFSLPPIREQPTPQEKNDLLIKKLKLCSRRCDFRLALKFGDTQEKKRIFNKSSMLSEIATYLKTTALGLEGANWNGLEVITQLFDTISSNLFRPIPDAYHVSHLNGVDHFIPITYTLPSWQHLEVIYEILHHTLSNKHIDGMLLTEYIKKYDFIRNFVHLLNTLDKNERNQIQSVLETFFNEQKVLHNELVLQLVAYCLDFIHYAIGSPHGVKSILNVLNSMSVIDAEIYGKVLVPLHKMRYEEFRCYEFVLWMYCKRVIEDDESLALILLRTLLQFWPRSNAYKEQQFLKKIAVILDFVDEDLWRECDRAQSPRRWRLFESVAYKLWHCLMHSCHYKTICDVLDVVETEEVQEFIDIYGGERLWCHLYQALHDIATHFYYFETVHKTKDTMTILRENDDIPMKYAAVFRQIGAAQVRMYPLPAAVLSGKNSCMQQLRITSKQETVRRKRYQHLRRVAQDTVLYKQMLQQKEKEKLEKEREKMEKEKQQKQLKMAQKQLASPSPVAEVQSRDDAQKPVPKAAAIPPPSGPPPPCPPTAAAAGVVADNAAAAIANGHGPRLGHGPRMHAPVSNTPAATVGVPAINDRRTLLAKTGSHNDVQKLSKQQRKQKEKEERARQKIEKQRQKEAEKLRKLREKKQKKEQQRLEKERKRRQKGRMRKSTDIDGRAKSINNPIAPKKSSLSHHQKNYEQFTRNNAFNSYLNTEYYEHDEEFEIDTENTMEDRDIQISLTSGMIVTKNASYAESPQLTFSYSSAANFDLPSIGPRDDDDDDDDDFFGTEDAPLPRIATSNSAKLATTTLPSARTKPAKLRVGKSSPNVLPPNNSTALRTNSKHGKASSVNASLLGGHIREKVKKLPPNKALPPDHDHAGAKNKAKSMYNINAAQIIPPLHSGARTLPPPPK